MNRIMLSSRCIYLKTPTIFSKPLSLSPLSHSLSLCLSFIGMQSQFVSMRALPLPFSSYPPPSPPPSLSLFLSLPLLHFYSLSLSTREPYPSLFYPLPPLSLPTSTSLTLSPPSFVYILILSPCRPCPSPSSPSVTLRLFQNVDHYRGNDSHMITGSSGHAQKSMVACQVGRKSMYHREVGKKPVRNKRPWERRSRTAVY